jgi:hypothetical protein
MFSNINTVVEVISSRGRDSAFSLLTMYQYIALIIYTERHFETVTEFFFSFDVDAIKGNLQSMYTFLEYSMCISKLYRQKK